MSAWKRVRGALVAILITAAFATAGALLPAGQFANAVISLAILFGVGASIMSFLAAAQLLSEAFVREPEDEEPPAPSPIKGTGATNRDRTAA